MKLTSCPTPLLLTFLALLPCTIVSAQLTPTDGNPFTPGGSGSFAVSSTQDDWLSFTAPQTMNATGIRVDLQAVGGGDPTLTYAIETGSGGVPNGMALASGTVTPTAAGFSEVDFSSPVALTAGTVYYAVVQASGTGDSIREYTSTGAANTNAQPYGYIDPNFGIGDKTTPIAVDGLPIVVLTDNGSYNAGNSITSTASVPIPAAAGLTQHFVFEQPSGNSITSATFRLAIGSSLSAPVTFTLEDNNNNVLAQTTEAASAFTLGATNNYTVNFSNVPGLTLGNAYNLVLTGPIGSSNLGWVANSTDTNTGDELATYEGTQGYAIGGSNGTTVELNQDYIFSYTTALSAPEPNTLNLAFLGLGGLAGLMFFRRSKSL